METFAKLFGSLRAWVYHCFDRIVILGHLPLLIRPENIVHFFRDVHQVKTISKEVLRQRTDDYHRWVEAFAKKRKIPMEWAEKGVRKEDYVRPHLRRMERRHQCGVYFILKSMELGPSFRSAVPKFPVEESVKRLAFHGRVNIRIDEVLIRNLVVFSFLIPFFAFWELRRVLGEGKLFDLFFRRRQQSNPDVSIGTQKAGKAEAVRKAKFVTLVGLTYRWLAPDCRGSPHLGEYKIGTT